MRLLVALSPSSFSLCMVALKHPLDRAGHLLENKFRCNAAHQAQLFRHTWADLEAVLLHAFKGDVYICWLQLLVASGGTSVHSGFGTTPDMASLLCWLIKSTNAWSRKLPCEVELSG